MRVRRTLLTLTALTGLVTAAAPASAQMPYPPVADQPAATLLLPYFEVDLAHPAGANTYFTVNNATQVATLAHVTIWSAMHVPVYSFDIYLTGYDVQALNVRDLINGQLPQTASAGQDPNDTVGNPDGISNGGAFSQDINFASCTGILPSAGVPQATVDHIRASLTGQQSPVTGQCATSSDGTRVARGYITVDVTRACTSMVPSDSGYFVAGGNGIASNENLLWGDYTYTNHIGGLDAGDASPLVHITASATDPQTSVPGEHTFYGRFVAWSAADNREPLSTNFMTRFVNRQSGQTTLTVWRDAKVTQGYFACGSTPAWYPLTQEGLRFFDEQENAELPEESPFPPQPPNPNLRPFALGAQRVAIGGSQLPTSFTSGVLFLNLNSNAMGSTSPTDDPAIVDFGLYPAQAFVSVHLKGTGRYSTGWHASMLDSAKEPFHFVPGNGF
jgi:hypothetical protein